MKKSVAAAIADTIGILMFVAGLAIIFAGEKTGLFKWVAYEHGGIEFLRTRLDYPFYGYLTQVIPDKDEDLYFLLKAVLIHGVVSVFYGFIGFVLGRLFSRR